MKKSILAVIPAICWLFISTFLLTLPGKAFPQTNWLDKIWADKWIHIGMFAIMTFLWCMFWSAQYGTGLKRAFLFIAVFCLVYGIGMEFVQKYLVANRSFDIGDIIADGVGCLTGLIYSNKRYIKK